MKKQARTARRSAIDLIGVFDGAVSCGQPMGINGVYSGALFSPSSNTRLRASWVSLLNKAFEPSCGDLFKGRISVSSKC